MSEVVDITAMGAGTRIKLRFYFDSIDGQDNKHQGWLIDDIRVFESAHDFDFLLKEDAKVVPVYDLQSPGQRPILREGYIKFTSGGKVRGVDLGRETTEYATLPGHPIDITCYIKNFDMNDTFAAVVYGIKVFNRYGIEVYHDSITVQLEPRNSDPRVLSWTPTVSDQYIIVVYCSLPGEEPPIDIYDYSSYTQDKVKYRPVKVYEPILNDDIETFTSDLEGKDWKSYTVASPDSDEHIDHKNNGDFRIQSEYYYSQTHSWRGGDFPWLGVPACQVIESPVIDGKDLYWVYRQEEYVYPSVLDLTESNRIGLYLTFYYMYSVNNFVRGDWGTLQINYSEGGEWQGWTTVWNTSEKENPHQFEPTQKLVWTHDYKNAIPTRVDLTGYLPHTYDPDFKFQLRFLVSGNWVVASKGWYIDDIQLLVIKPEFNFSFTATNTPLVIPHNSNESATFLMEVLAKDCNFQAHVSLNGYQTSGPTIPWTGSKRWVNKTRPEYFNIVGGDIVSASYTLAANATPTDGLYTFSVWANMTWPEWPTSGNTVFSSMVELTLKVGKADIEIYLTNGTAHRGVYAGASVVYNLTVRNANTTNPDPLDIVITYAPTSLNGWNVTFNQTYFENVGPGEERLLNLTVTSPPQALPDVSLNLSVSAHSTIDTLNKATIFLNTTVNATHNLTLSASPGVVKAAPGTKAFFLIQVDNRGNENGDVTMALVSLPEGWDEGGVIFRPETIENLMAYSQDVVTMEVQVPDVEDGMYPIEINATMDDYVANLTVYVNVSEPYKLDLHPVDGNTFTAFYNETTKMYDEISIDIDVYNNGSQRTVITFHVEGSALDWTTVPDNTPPINKTDDNNPYKVHLLVDIPENEATAGTYTLVVNGTSTADGSVYEVESFTIVIPPRYDLSMTADPLSVGLTPGVSKTILVTVENRGNTEDTITLAHNMPSGWTGTFDNGMDTLDVTLSAFTQTQVQLTVSVDLTVEAGQHTFNITATSQGDTNVTEQVVVTANVAVQYEVEITGDVVSAQYDPAGSLEYATFDITVENAGNHYADITLSAEISYGGSVNTAYKSWVEYRVDGTPVSSSLSLDAGEAKDVEIRVTPDRDALGGNYTIRLTASILAAGVEDRIDLSLTVKSIHDLSASLDHDSLTLLEGNMETVNLTITNDGNVNEVVTITVIAETPGASETWISVDTPVNVEPDSSAKITVNVMVPPDTEKGKYIFTIKVSSPEGGTNTETLDVTVSSTGGFFGMSTMEMGILLLVVIVVILLVALAMPPKKPAPYGMPPPQQPQYQSPSGETQLKI
ncbi:MAG: hypothetical protein J7L61_00505 [Thermoplasmata archaeon]|nr:hypothetical protein [Thermoplasmata archaeon]